MPKRIDKIRESGRDELQLQERELTEQIFRLRFQLSTGQAEALRRLRDARKDLARVKTHLRAQELNATTGAHIPVEKPVEEHDKPAEKPAEKAAAKTSAEKAAKPAKAKKHHTKSTSKTKKAGKR
jgi:large subunit ribosomal protein L29